MRYNDFKGLKLSALGMGCMRLPTKENFETIDMEETRKMVDSAMKNGVNYYDTAWGYHNGKSELAMGEILKDYPRESFYLADKFPGYDLNNINKVEEIFEKQLEKCQTEYFDFYMFHNLCELNVEQYLDPKYRIFEYLIAQKKNGRIRHLGVSAHGNLDTMKKFLEKYGEYMEFCQLQINWLDWEFQSAKEKVELLNSYNIPVWVMEPLRGGGIINLNDYQQKLISEAFPEKSNLELAFGFTQSIPEVKVTLSGMSNFDQLKQNVDLFNEGVGLTEGEMEKVISVARKMTSENTLPCTSCKYCVSHCPLELDIPWFIELFNEHTYSGGGFIAPMALDAVAEGKRPSDCLGCGACEAVCPQNIKISQMMKDFTEKVKY